EEVLGLADYRLTAAELAAWGDQLRRVEGAPAVVALVAPCVRVTAVGASALDVAVGQEALVGLAVELGHCLGVDVAPLVEHAEDVLRHRGVVLGVSVGEEVEA